MAAAVAAMVGIQVASQVAQYYQAEQARKANKKKLKEIKKLWDSIVPPEYNVDITDPPELIAERIPAPALDLSGLTPEDYKVMEKYVPTIARTVAEVAPQLVEETARERRGTEAMEETLREYRRLGKGGFDPIAAAQMEQVQREAEGAAARQRGAVLESAARRGVLDSTATLAAQLQGQESAQQRAAMLQQQAMADAYRRRLEALRGQADVGQRIGTAERQREASNVDIINAFNQRMSARQQQQENMRAEALSRAALQNVQTAQRVGEQNVQLDWQAQKLNRDMLNKGLITQAEFEQRERQLYNDALTKQFQMQRSNEDEINRLKGRAYEDQLRKMSGQVGVKEAEMGQQQQQAQDKARTIQGIGKAATSGVNAYSQAQGAQDTTAQPAAEKKANIFDVPDPFADDEESEMYKYDASIYDPSRTA